MSEILMVDAKISFLLFFWILFLILIVYLKWREEVKSL